MLDEPRDVGARRNRRTTSVVLSELNELLENALAQAFDMYWQVLPVLHRDTIHLHWLDVAAAVFMLTVLALSGLWGFRRVPLIPIRDVRLNETIGYENETP